MTVFSSTMISTTGPCRKYLDTLLQYYEEEVAGEAEFYDLAEHFSERDKTILLARIERVAAESVKPLLEKYGLVPRDDATLHEEGRNFVEGYKSWSWERYLNYVVERFPAYLDDFHNLEAMAPAEDLPALRKLTEHELAVIDFANRELAGEANSTAPLLEYLK